MAWGYWSATAVDRGRSPRRNTHTVSVPINALPHCEPPPPTCDYSPCRSRCSSPCHSPCQSPCPGSPCSCSIVSESPPPSQIQQQIHQQHLQHHTQDDYGRRPSIDRLDSPQVLKSYLPILIGQMNEFL